MCVQCVPLMCNMQCAVCTEQYMMCLFIYMYECSTILHCCQSKATVCISVYLNSAGSHFLQQLCSSFEIFHMREALIPVDTIEIKG